MKGRINIICLFILVGCLTGIGLHTAQQRPKLLSDEKNANDRVISFFRKDYKELLRGMEEEALDSPLIVEVVGTGKKKYVQGELLQEVSFVRVIRGEKNRKQIHEHMFLMGNGWSETEKQISTGFTNYLQNGEHYIVFAQDIYETMGKDNSVLKANMDLIGLRCINISTDHSTVCKTKKKHAKYGEVRDSEFFCNDEETLQRMQQYKYNVMKKLGVEPLW